METKTMAYKVVRCIHGAYESAVLRSGHLLTIYEVGKWTVKRKYGPMVFNNYDCAVSFIFTEQWWTKGTFKLFECEVEDMRNAPRLLKVEDVAKLNLETVRRQIDRNVRDYPFPNAPSGSYITSRIKLVREVPFHL